MARTGGHDRRFFDIFLKLNLVMIVVTFLFMVFVNIPIGLVFLMIACISFITMESISSPPANRPEVFMYWSRRAQPAVRRPVLLCLGDDLTHGNLSATFTPELPSKLSEQLGLDPPVYGKTFADPLWVVNDGQNLITSHTILQERLNHALGCYPDFICLLVGTNDVRAMYSAVWAKQTCLTNSLLEVPNLQSFERNFVQLLQFIRQASPMVRIGVCTLPPMGEQLTSTANALVKQANQIIQDAVTASKDDKCTIIPLFEQMESVLEKKKQRSSTVFSLANSPDFFPILDTLLCPLYYVLGYFFDWNTISYVTGGELLWDGLHLNERGADILVDAIVEWLMSVQVAKAIAVKAA